MRQEYTTVITYCKIGLLSACAYWDNSGEVSTKEQVARNSEGPGTAGPCLQMNDAIMSAASVLDAQLHSEVYIFIRKLTLKENSWT